MMSFMMLLCLYTLNVVASPRGDLVDEGDLLYLLQNAVKTLNP